MTFSPHSDRELIPGLSNNLDQKSRPEHFQNLVIRPLLKSCNDLFLIFTKYHLKHLHPHYFKLDDNTQNLFLKNMIINNIELRNQLLGMVIGKMDPVELEEFLFLQKDIRKRTITMLIERIIGQKNNFLT